MKTALYLFAVVLLALEAPAFAQAATPKVKKIKPGAPVVATPTPVPETGYGLFRMIRLKNIFDPDRRPMPVEGGKPSAPVANGPRTSYVTLTGTMITEGRRLAFFSGTQSDYNRVAKAHDKLGELEVEAISTASVDLKRGDEKFVLPVGKQLSLGERAVISNAPVRSEPMTPSALPPSPSASAPPPPPAGEVGAPLDQAEIMRRMMERRLKETK